jgi:hypothetical protein
MMFYNYRRLLATFDEAIPALVARQIDAVHHPESGGFVGPDGLAGPNQVSSAATFGYAYLLPESRHSWDRALVDRIERAAEWGRRRRTPGGRFDLLATNFDSSPDTGFTIQALAPVVRAARKAAGAGDSGAGQIAEALGELIHTAAPGMVAGGFHTPNHRWVLVSALSMALELFPDLDEQVRPTIDAYLAETIDINVDGEYIERSTAVYNPVVDRALRLAAESLQRWELLDPVRANLELSYHLMHGDATVVTSISSRQDRGARVVPTGLVDSYYTIARRDGDGRFAAIADWLLEKGGGGGGTWALEPFLTHPEWRDDGDVPRQSPETSYRKYYTAARLWRTRRGDTSATVAEGLDTPFSLRHGAAELSSVRISSTYFATGRFVGTEMAPVDGDRGTRLHHAGANSLYPEKVYDRPIYWLPIDDGTIVDAGNWQEVRGRRKTFELPPMAIDLEITEASDGGDGGASFDLHVTTTGGVPSVPLQIELLFEPGGTMEVERAIVEAHAGTTMFLKGGNAVYRVGDDEITVGPGHCAHTMWKMHNSPGAPESFRLLVSLLSPVDHTLRLQTGKFQA